MINHLHDGLSDTWNHDNNTQVPKIAGDLIEAGSSDSQGFSYWVIPLAVDALLLGLGYCAISKYQNNRERSYRDDNTALECQERSSLIDQQVDLAIQERVTRHYINIV